MAAAALCVPAEAVAQSADLHTTFGGDLQSRPRLTGDWWDVRDAMAARGVTLDVDALQTLQGVASGGRDSSVAYGGTVDYTLNVDTGKLVKWPGGFLKVYAISGYGDSVNGDAASFATLPDTASILPEPTTSTALMSLTYTQFLSPWFGVYLGKINGLEGDPNEFAHDYRTQFMNLGLFINPALLLAPLSAYGGGVVLLPWDGAVVNAGVMDPDGTPSGNDLGEAFSNGVQATVQGRATVKPFGLVGHQTVGFLWSNKERPSLSQDPNNIANMLLRARFPRLNDPGPILERFLERFFPQLLAPVQPLATKSESWGVYYNFDQYLWSPQGEPDSGIGLFFRFGVSDGNPNPVKYAYNVGIGGKGVVPGRRDDSFGVGWVHIQYSRDFVPFLRDRLDLGLATEDAVEMYYNAAITKWFNLSLDLQVVNPGLNKTLGPDNQLKDVNTAVIAGLRAYLRF